MVSTLYSWQADPLFLAAEEVQDSAERLQSSFHQWQLLIQRREAGIEDDGNRLADDDPEDEVVVVTVDQQVDEEGVRLVVLSACDTLRWQLEAFERAAREDEWRQAAEGGSTADAHLYETRERRRQFTQAIRVQLSQAEAVVRPAVGGRKGTPSVAPVTAESPALSALPRSPEPFSPSPIPPVQPERLVSFLTPPSATPPSTSADTSPAFAPRTPPARASSAADARDIGVAGAGPRTTDGAAPGRVMAGAAAAAAAASAAFSSSAAAFSRWLSADRLETPPAAVYLDDEEEEGVQKAWALQREPSDCESAPLCRRTSSDRAGASGPSSGGKAAETRWRRERRARQANWQCLVYWLQHLQRPGDSDDDLAGMHAKEGLGAGRLRLDGRADMCGEGEMQLLHFNGPNSHVGRMHTSWPAQRLTFEDEEDEDEEHGGAAGPGGNREETQRLVLGWQLSVKRKRRVADGEGAGKAGGTRGRALVCGMSGRQVACSLVGLGVLLLALAVWLGLVSFGVVPAPTVVVPSD